MLANGMPPAPAVQYAEHAVNAASPTSVDLVAPYRDDEPDENVAL